MCWVCFEFEFALTCLREFKSITLKTALIFRTSLYEPTCPYTRLIYVLKFIYGYGGSVLLLGATLSLQKGSRWEDLCWQTWQVFGAAGYCLLFQGYKAPSQGLTWFSFTTSGFRAGRRRRMDRIRKAGTQLAIWSGRSVSLLPKKIAGGISPPSVRTLG